MPARIPSRLTELLLLAAAIILALVWAERLAWRQIGALRAEITPAHLAQVTADSAATEQFVAATHSALARVRQFLLLSLVGLLVSGTVILILIYRRMITPLRTDLSESRAIIERQEKLASLGVLAAGIAHEIRNPLTAIKVRVFSLKASAHVAASDHEDLEVIENEIDRLERIVRDFLQFARPTEPKLQPVAATRLLQDAAALLSADLAKRGLQLQLELGTEGTVLADADKMKQVLINMIQNAAESTERGGTITLRTRVEKRARNGRADRVLVLEVSDTGRGIPPEVQNRMFDPFFTTKESGTGLGLGIAARIVEQHDGAIHYQTELNRGTTFSIVLPLAADHESQA
ncbi:MAG TPA: ATP-binding protein [Verrucomicrobiota bacterium]|nr:ATP-binding protein [Verrucomicrobiota bacterium]HNT14907.1 ATP-binding protein [Verrucomicrobiota bacterium]